MIHSAKLNGHDPYAYLRDVLERLPTQQASRIGDLLPHVDALRLTHRETADYGSQDAFTARLQAPRKGLALHRRR